jgi:hypothetical protein
MNSGASLHAFVRPEDICRNKLKCEFLIFSSPWFPLAVMVRIGNFHCYSLLADFSPCTTYKPFDNYHCACVERLLLMTLKLFSWVFLFEILQNLGQSNMRELWLAQDGALQSSQYNKYGNSHCSTFLRMDLHWLHGLFCCIREKSAQIGFWFRICCGFIAVLLTHVSSCSLTNIGLKWN